MTGNRRGPLAILVGLLAAFVAAAAASPDARGRATTAPDPRAGVDVRGGPYLLVVNKSGSSLSVLDPGDGEEVARVPTRRGPHEVAVSPDGRRAYVTDYGTRPEPGGTVSVVDLERFESLGTIDIAPHSRPHGVAVLSDGSVWVTAEGSQHVLELDPERRTVIRAVETGQSGTHMVAVSEEHGRLYTANIGSGTVTAVDLATGEVLGHLETGAGAEGIDVSPDGETVYVTNREAGTLTEIDVVENRVRRSLEVGRFPIRVEVRPGGGKALVSDARADGVVVVSLEQWRIVRELPVGSQPVGVLIVPGGETAYVANTRADRISVLDLARWRVTGELVAGEEPDGMAWVSPSGP